MQLSTSARKAVALGLTASTVLWASVMGLAPLTASAAVHSDGCVVLSGGVVWLITNGTRRGFTSAEVFASSGYNFSQVVGATAEDVALPAGPIMTYADGTLVKGPNDPLVYLVTGGSKRPFVSGAVFTGLGFSFANIQQAPANTFADLPTGANLDNASSAHGAGVLVISNGGIWLMTANGRMGMPSMAVFQSYGYMLSHVVAANAADLAMADQGALASRPACSGGGTPAPTSGNVNVSLSSDSPVSGTVIAGQALADLAHFNFSGSGTVTMLRLKRTGVSADSTLSNVYLFNGNVRITDSATVSSGFITFNNASGLFNVSGSTVISVRSDIASSTSGQTVGVMVDSTSLSGGVAVGTPAGSLFTVAAAPTTFATVDFNTTTTPAGATITAQNDYVMWQNVVAVGNNPVVLKSLRLRQIGSVFSTDLGNFRLYVDGTQVGSAVSAMSSDGYINFDLGVGVNLSTGNRTVKMVGDIISGANRNFQWSLRVTADVLVVDPQFNQPVLPTANGSTFSARSTGAENIDTGTLTFTKRSDSPSGNVVLTASGVTMAKFDVKAAGEDMKVESLRVTATEDDSDTAYCLRNGSLFLDGAQIGSTACIRGASDSTATYTEYTFGSSFIVKAGQTRVLEVRGDVYDSQGANGVTANDTIRIDIVGSSNVLRLTSLGYVSRPASTVSGNTLTVATGSLTVAKNTAYANQSFVAPKFGYKIGSYTIQASTTEGANITSVVIDLDENLADAFTSSAITNLYVVMGSYTSPIKATVTASDNTFSTNVSIAPGATMNLDVYGDIAASSTNGSGAADTLASSATVSYTTTASSTSTSATEVVGQTLTSTSGTFTTSLDQSSPLNRIVAANQEVEAMDFRITSTNETYTVKQVQVKVTSATVSSAIVEARLYYGSTLLGTAPFVQATNTAALFTGLETKPESVIAPNGFKTYTVKLLLNTIGSSSGTSQVNAATTLDSVEYLDSQGVDTTDTNDRAGNELYVYRTIPTVSQVAVTNAKIVNGNPMDLYSFTVTASSQGPVSVKQFTFPITWTDGSGASDTLKMDSWKFFEDGTDITDRVVIQDQGGNDAETTNNVTEADSKIHVSWNTTLEGVVNAGATKTYKLRATPQGFNTTDAAANPADNFGLYLAGDAAHNGTSIYLNGTATATTIWGMKSTAAATGTGTLKNFIWSDQSAAPHNVNENASSSGDWADGYKVLNLDLNSQTFND